MKQRKRECRCMRAVWRWVILLKIHAFVNCCRKRARSGFMLSTLFGWQHVGKQTGREDGSRKWRLETKVKSVDDEDTGGSRHLTVSSCLSDLLPTDSAVS